MLKKSKLFLELKAWSSTATYKLDVMANIYLVGFAQFRNDIFLIELRKQNWCFIVFQNSSQFKLKKP